VNGRLCRVERHKNRRRLAAVRLLDNVDWVQRSPAAVISRNKPQQGDRTRDVGNAAKRHLLRAAAEYNGVTVLRSGEREICIDGGMLNLCPTSEVP